MAAKQINQRRFHGIDAFARIQEFSDSDFDCGETRQRLWPHSCLGNRLGVRKTVWNIAVSVRLLFCRFTRHDTRRRSFRFINLPYRTSNRRLRFATALFHFFLIPLLCCVLAFICFQLRYSMNFDFQQWNINRFSCIFSRARCPFCPFYSETKII